jgi:hypothetical protein
MHPCGWNYKKAKGQDAKKEFVFALRILGFHFFSLLPFTYGFA